MVRSKWKVILICIFMEGYTVYRILLVNISNKNNHLSNNKILQIFKKKVLFFQNFSWERQDSPWLWEKSFMMKFERISTLTFKNNHSHLVAVKFCSKFEKKWRSKKNTHGNLISIGFSKQNCEKHMKILEDSY